MNTIESWLVDFVVTRAAEKFGLTDDETARVQASIDNLIYVAEAVIQRQQDQPQMQRIAGPQP